MKKKILSATICLIIVFTLFTVFGVSVNAACNERYIHRKRRDNILVLYL